MNICIKIYLLAASTLTALEAQTIFAPLGVNADVQVYDLISSPDVVDYPAPFWPLVILREDRKCYHVALTPYYHGHAGARYAAGRARQICARGKKRLAYATWDEAAPIMSRRILRHEAGHLIGATHQDFVCNNMHSDPSCEGGDKVLDVTRAQVKRCLKRFS